MGSLCALNRIPLDPELLLKQFPPPHTTDTLIHAVRALGFRIKLKHSQASSLGDMALPSLALLSPAKDDGTATGEDNVEATAAWPKARLGLITDVSPERVQFFEAATNAPTEVACEAFAQRYLGAVFLVAKARLPILDPYVVGSATRFGFRWFVPDLLKHKKVWRDVLLASLVMQLLALGAPVPRAAHRQAGRCRAGGGRL